MEEEDPVVQEIPVYLSQALAQNLYIYQYPVRSANRDFRDEKVIRAAIKPKNRMVKLEIGLDIYSDEYCPSKGEQIALNTDGRQESSWHKREKEQGLYFKDGVMDKIVYESSAPCIDTQRYAVAILQDKELHCTPIQGIIQMRPSCSYFDKQDKRNLEKNKAENGDNDEKETDSQQVTVTFSRQETDVAKKAREKSYEAVKSRIAEEPWYEATWHHPDSDYADLDRLKLFSAVTSDGPALTLNSRDYIRLLVPAPPADEEGGAVIATLSLQDQIKALLISAKLLRFSEIKSLIRSETPVSDSSLLGALIGVGCCVRGVWTARSDDVMQTSRRMPPAARDHILYLFTQHQYVDRRKVTAVVRLPPSEVLEIMQSVAKYDPSTGWELLIPPDTAFEAKYPEVMQRQNLYWEARQRIFNEMLIGENVPRRQRKKSQRESTSSDTMMSPKPRGSSVSEEDGERRRQKNKSATGKRNRNVSSSSGHEPT